jgi:alpha-1,6-mannosyltransferase
MWVAVANPMMVINMIGGGHNDLLVVGLLAAGALLALRGQHAGGIALVTLAMAVKASAGLALPFLVLVWAAHMTGSRWVRIAKAAAAGIAVFTVVFGACTLLAGVDLGWLPALSAPSMIVNWMSIPTAIGQIVGWFASLFGGSQQLFVNIFRGIGAAVLLWIAVRQWWAARDGGPDAIRRAGIVLLATSVLSPATLPWYVSWGMAFLAMTPWTVRGLQCLVVASTMLVIVYYPNGEEALDNWGYLAACLAVALLAAWSLVKPDPLRLAAGARSKPDPAEEPPANPSEAPATERTAPPVAAEPRAS